MENETLRKADAADSASCTAPLPSASFVALAVPTPPTAWVGGAPLTAGAASVACPVEFTPRAKGDSSGFGGFFSTDDPWAGTGDSVNTPDCRRPGGGGPGGGALKSLDLLRAASLRAACKVDFPVAAEAPSATVVAVVTANPPDAEGGLGPRGGGGRMMECGGLP